MRYYWAEWETKGKNHTIYQAREEKLQFLWLLARLKEQKYTIWSSQG